MVVGAALIGVGALGQRWLTNVGDSPAAALPRPAASAVKPPPVATPAAAPVGVGEVTAAGLGDLLNVIDAERRQQILASPEVFKQFVQQEALNQAVLKAAYANKAEQNPQIRTLMERAAQRALGETYLNQVVRVNLDPKFPSEAQMREAYDKNPEAFRVPERVHLWQIFLPIDPKGDDKQSKAAWSRAEKISRDLRAGKGDFGALAKQYSAHEASRVNDGYMGLLKSADLLAPVAEAVKKLKVGEVSEPIASESGLHVIKRGAVVASETVPFERVHDQLRARMAQEAAAKVRQAAIEKMGKEFPVSVPPDDTLGAWRDDLAKAPAAGETAEAAESADPPQP